MNRGVGAHGRPGHVRHRDPPTHAAGRGSLAEDHLRRRSHVEVEAKLIRLLRFHGSGAGVGGVQQHLELVVGCEGSAEGCIVEDPEFLANVLHVNLHLLHGAVENALGLLHGEGDLFGHEVAVVDGDPGPACKHHKTFTELRRPR